MYPSKTTRFTNHSRPLPGLYSSPISSSATNTSSPGSMSLFNTAASTANANPTQGDLTKDVQLSTPPEDSISDIVFSPQSEHLAVASWDKKVRIYEIDANGNSQGKAYFEHEGPVLSCCWSKVCARVEQRHIFLC
jgi:WD40 repeat protein